MTELELVEAANSYLDLMLDSLSLYITVTSGYLLVAYFAGNKLTRSQVTLISTLYFFVAIVSTYGIYAWLQRGIGYAIKQGTVNPNLTIYGSPIVSMILGLLCIAGILASLKFMRDVRHPKKE